MPKVDSTSYLGGAPIPSGGAQLNTSKRKTPAPALAVDNGPTTVKPLLATFDFTGICGRYMDSNGYSVRIGGNGSATPAVMLDEDIVLMSTGPNGDEVVMARAGGLDDGYVG